MNIKGLLKELSTGGAMPLSEVEREALQVSDRAVALYRGPIDLVIAEFGPGPILVWYRRGRMTKAWRTGMNDWNLVRPKVPLILQ